MDKGDAKDANEVDDGIVSYECLRSIHCGDSCAKDGCEVGQEEHLELDECIRSIHCLRGFNQTRGHTAGSH